MPKEILMPALSPTMEEGKLAKWNKKEGDQIKSGDIIAEIETDKAIMEFEAVEEGVLGKILVEEGSEQVKVNSPIAVLLKKGEDKSALEGFEVKQAAANTEIKKEENKTQNDTTPQKKSEDHKLQQFTPMQAHQGSNKHIFASPLAKVLAKQNNVDITQITGSGPNGRIVKQDILTFIEQQKSGVIAPYATKSEFADIPNSGMRKTIAKRLLESKVTVPHYYLTVDCIVDNLLLARVELNQIGKDKYKISVNDFIIKAVGLAMRDVPEANSYWQGETSRVFSRSDVAVAVAIPNGLITPIIRDATAKGLIVISQEMKELAQRAKEGKLKPEEYQGGGFSISNLGMFGIKEFAAIINPPQAGILAIGATEKRPVVVKDNIVIANVMTITLSADHRVLDGAVGATFLTAVKRYLENPATMLL